MVHHDLWDYDVASQPILIEFGPEKTPAVVVTTKMGFVYVLDRKTGKPLSPVEERPVPKSDVPGEDASPTQPFPVTLQPLVPSVFKPFGLTDADRKWCTEQVERAALRGHLHTPKPERHVSISRQCRRSGVGRSAYDPEREDADRQHEPDGFVIRLIPRDQARPREKKPARTVCLTSSEDSKVRHTRWCGRHCSRLEGCHATSRHGAR